MEKLALNKRKIIGFVLNKAVIILLIVFIIVMALVSRVFGTWENITNILAEFTVYGAQSGRKNHIRSSAANSICRRRRCSPGPRCSSWI